MDENSVIMLPTDSSRDDSYSEQLEEITDELLTQNEPGKLRQAALQLYALFSEITGVSEESDNPEDLQTTILPNGKAISPKNAGRCVREFTRTAKFLRGLNNALSELEKSFPGQPLEILYAGCGPFATLIAPLAGRFDAGQLRITLLDIHNRSLKSARLVFETLGLEVQLNDCVQADAAVYHHPHPLHLVISETMLTALGKEPQVAVTYNLAPQLCEGGIFVPQKITVDACLYRPATEMTFIPVEADISLPEEIKSKRIRIELGRIFELSAEQSGKIAGKEFLPSIVLDLPQAVDEKLRLLLATTVTVFESVVLEEYESSITYPRMLNNYAPADCGDQIEFIYRLGSNPGFEYRCLNH